MISGLHKTAGVFLLTLLLGCSEEQSPSGPAESTDPDSSSQTAPELSSSDTPIPAESGLASSPSLPPSVFENHSEGQEALEKSPEELFSNETLEQIEKVLDEFPDIRSIEDMAGTEGYMNWRREKLPEFNWDKDMNTHLQEGIRMVAASNGIEGRPDVSVKMKFSEAGLQRAVGHAIDGDLDGYRGELKKAIDNSVVASMASQGEDAPIRVRPLAPEL